jgi:hypothetical protein
VYLRRARLTGTRLDHKVSPDHDANAMTHRWIGVLSLAALQLSAQEPPTGSFSGVVRDELGRPIREALIVLDAETTPMRARSDVEGRFRIDRVAVGGHELQIVRIGFRPHRSRIEMTVAGVTIEVTLQAAPVLLDTIAVRVARTGIHGIVVTRGISLLPHEPRPLRGAIVEVLDHTYRTTSGRDGTFRIDAIQEGAFSLLVRLDRYQTRLVPAHVPATGGLDMTIVLDSTIADWQRREDYQLRDISRRLREANNPSALVSEAELAGPEGQTLKDALRVAPSTLSRGMLAKDDVTCVYVNAQPRPGMTAGDILAEDVHAVEAYGTGSGVTPPVRWLLGTFCGTGARMGPFHIPGLPAGARPRPEMDNIIRVLMVWTKRGR